MLVTSVLSLKGGVGKTSVVLGLASAALGRGIPTLVVDLDPQANATLTLEPPGTSATVADVLAHDDARVSDAVAESAWGAGVRIIPGSEAAEQHNHPDPAARALARLQRALTQVKPAPELVLIDCPPSLGQLTRNGLVASNAALLVTEPGLYAVTGVQRAMEAVEDERREHQPELRVAGIVVNRVRARSTEHAYRIGELRELFGPLVLSPTLPDRSAVQQAQGAGLPLHRWPTAGAREVAGAFELLLDSLLAPRV
ncbi:MAG: ParA family protein [Nakamurella sp.]